MYLLPFFNPMSTEKHQRQPQAAFSFGNCRQIIAMSALMLQLRNSTYVVKNFPHDVLMTERYHADANRASTKTSTNIRIPKTRDSLHPRRRPF